jgi:hypothetical protein
LAANGWGDCAEPKADGRRIGSDDLAATRCKSA